MLKSIHIKNFQSHKDTTLKLSSGVNVITGSSDVGKSAIIRAMRWVFENKPIGAAYISTFAGKEPTEVTINLVGGAFVTRRRSKAFNGYVVGEYDKWEKKFAAIKTDVPDAVKKLFTLAKYNMRSQHDGPYLIADSPPKVSKELSDLVGIGIIDDAVGIANTTSRRINGEINGLEDELTTLSANIAQLDGVDVLDSGLDAAVDSLDKLEELARQHEGLGPLISRAKQLEEQLAVDFELVESAGDLLSIAEDQCKTIKETEAERRDLRKLIDRSLQLNTDMGEVTGELTQANVMFDDIVKDIYECPICSGPISQKHKEILRSWVLGGDRDEAVGISRLAFT